MMKNAIVSATIVRLVQDHWRGTVVIAVVLVAVLAALLALGVSERSATAQSEPETVGRVTGLTATAEGQPPGTVHLTWNAAENAQVYFVYYIEEKDLNVSNWSAGQMRAFNVTEATIDGLAGGTTYYFAASGMRWHFGTFKPLWGGWDYWQAATPTGSAASPTPVASQLEPEIVGAVTGLAASAEGKPSGTVRLTWNAAEDAQVYFVYYIEEKDLNVSNWSAGQMRAFNVTEATIDGLAGGTTYYFAASGMRWHFGRFEPLWGARSQGATATPALSGASLSDLERADRLEPAQADQLKALPWIADGIDDSERDAAQMLIDAANHYPDTFIALLQKPWVLDNDMTAAETSVIHGIRWAAKFAPALSEQMQQISWVQDNITRDEASVIYYLYRITHTEDESLQQEVIQQAIDILAMPFLETVESPDALAVWDLSRIVGRNSNDFLDVMASPKVSDGITDQEAKVVAVLSGAHRFKPESLPVLLDGLDGTNGVYLEERTIELAHSGEVLLVVLRLRDQITLSMDYLEHGVRNVEEFMGESLPTNYVALYFDDATVPFGGGHNAGTHIVTRPEHDDLDYPRRDVTPGHIAHEVGHYYWKGNSNRGWISEGAADLVSFISEKVRIQRPLEPDRGPCPYFKNISQLEQADPALGSPENSCNYSLGQRLFLDLYHTLGDADFRQGFRNLYLSAERGRLAGDCEDDRQGICHVEAAFKAGASDEVAAKVDEVIDRWYYGTAPVSFSDLEHAARLEEDKPALADQIKALLWVADGVDYSERAAAEALIAAAIWYPDTFNALLQMSWVTDSVTDHETTVIRRIRWTAQDAPALAEPMLQKSWVQDGITRDEAIVIERLYWTIRTRDESLQPEVIQKAIEILAMPFLDTVESPDALAVWDLEKIESYRTNDFLSIMSHTNVSDGITDQEAKVVAVLSSANRYKPDSLPILLDGLDGTGGVYLEERAIELDLSGEVQLTIIRVIDKDTPNMDRLEHAVRVVEEFMGEPLPTNYVAWYLDDAARSAGKGYHAGTHITSSLVYDIVDGDSKSRTPMQHIAHEVGHYYFRGNTHQWLDEGPAKFFESISEKERVGRPVAYFKQSCGPAKTIQEQEQLRNDIRAGLVTAPDGWTQCDYYLGERFFVDLYLAMGDEAFRPGLRSLYLKSQHDDPDDDCEGTDLSLCHVEAAFKTGVSDDVIAKVDEVIDRWYYGTAPALASPLDGLANGAWLEANKTALAYQLKALPWVADGIDETESDAAQRLVELAIWWPDTFNALLQKSWIQDDITRDEATVIEHIYLMTSSYSDEATKQRVSEAVATLLDMPFLDSIEPTDVTVVIFLQRLARYDLDTFDIWLQKAPHLHVLVEGNTRWPSEQQPVSADDVIARLAAGLFVSEHSHTPAESVRAHPAAADFPYLVPTDAPRITRSVTIHTEAMQGHLPDMHNPYAQPGAPRRHSTGMYAAPGELVTVTVPNEVAEAGDLHVRVGAHSDSIWNRDEWKRMPEISRRFPITTTSTHVANAFGGLIYVEIPVDAALGSFTVEIKNGVAAPLFVLGETDPDEWRNVIRHAPAPWAEIVGRNMAVTTDSREVRGLDDPAAVAEVWDRMLDLSAELAAWPSAGRSRLERFVVDRQISLGYMHSGYPLMAHLDKQSELVDAEFLRSEGDWGLFHEVGHNHQADDWTFNGTVEVTVNLFTLYIYEFLCGVPVTTEKWDGSHQSRAELMALYDFDSPDFELWKREPFLALIMYAQLQEAFGWDAYRQVFATYRALPESERPKTDDEKRDQWMVRFSHQVGRNLGPFFEAWGVPTSEAARDSISDLSVWMPPDFPPRPKGE